MSDTRIKISVDLPNGQVYISDPETDKPLLSVEGLVLSMLPGRTEAKLIVDEPIIKGDWVVPVTEQLVLSRDITDLLADRVEAKIIARIQRLQEMDERIKQHAIVAEDIPDPVLDQIASRVMERLAIFRTPTEEKVIDNLAYRVANRLGQMSRAGGTIS